MEEDPQTPISELLKWPLKFIIVVRKQLNRQGLDYRTRSPFIPRHWWQPYSQPHQMEPRHHPWKSALNAGRRETGPDGILTKVLASLLCHIHAADEQVTGNRIAQSKGLAFRLHGTLQPLPEQSYQSSQPPNSWNWLRIILCCLLMLAVRIFPRYQL